MQSKTRIALAMDLRIPDRVPLMCQMSIGYMVRVLAVSPEKFWNDPDVYAAGLRELRRRYEFDGILISLHGHDPAWRDRMSGCREVPDGVMVKWLDGSSTLYPGNDLPRHFPLVEPARPDLSAWSPGLLPTSLDYIPVSQGLHFHLDRKHLFDVIEILVAAEGAAVSIHGEVTSPFDYYLDLVGHQEGLLGLLDYPETATSILQRFSALIRELASEMCDAGVDAIKLSSPFAGAGFISKEMYERFVLPHESEIVRAVREKGRHIYVHTCGAIADRLDLLFASGASGIECLDPPPLGNVELERAKVVAAGKGFIKGNIDSVNTLLRGSADGVLADARQRLEVGRQGGGFILSTACSIAPHVPESHVRLLHDAVERWG